MKKYLLSAAFALLPTIALAQAAPFEHVGVRVSWNDLPFNPPYCEVEASYSVPERHAHNFKLRRGEDGYRVIITSYDWLNSRSGEHYPDISVAFPGRNHARHVGAEGWHNGITFMLSVDEVGLLRSDARMTLLRDRPGGAVAMTDLSMTGVGSAIAEADSCLERLQREAEERAARERAINHIERDPFGQ